MSVYAVLGAGGGVGLECVMRLVAVAGSTGSTVRAIVRNPAKYAGAFPAGVEVVAGDVSDKASLRTALAGAKGIVFAAAGRHYFSPSQVDFQGVANTAEVAKEVGAEHVVLVSSMLTTPKNRMNLVRIILNNIRYSLMDYKFKGEEALRGSGQSYTIVRPGGLGKGPGGQASFVTAQGDSVQASKRINRADVAAVCVKALSEPAARNVTLELWTAPAPGLDQDLDSQLSSMWGALKADGTA